MLHNTDQQQLTYRASGTNNNIDIQINLPLIKVNMWQQNSQGFIEDILLAHKVTASGVPNRFGCRIPVCNNWNIPFLEAWLRDYEDFEVVEWIKFGFSVSRDDSAPDPTPTNINHKGANEFPEAIDEYLSNEIKLGSTMGPFDIPPFVTRIGISPLSSREKKNSGKRRIILDLSFPEGASVNSAIDKHFYCGKPIDLRYPTIDTLSERVARLGVGTLMWKKDMQRFFRQLSLCPRDYSLIGYRWRNSLFFDKSIPMGLTSAAYCAQRVSSAIVFMHRQLGYWSINYLDDFGSAEKPSDAVSSYNVMESIIRSTGLQEATEKAVPPTTRLEFLGNTIDSIKMTLEVSPERKTELLKLLVQWRHMHKFSKKQLQSLVGKLSFITNCVRPGRIFLSRLIDRIAHSSEHDINIIDTDMRKDLKWWEAFLPDFSGVSILWLQDCLVTDYWLASDASLVGGGAVHQHQFFHIKFNQETLDNTTNIAQREMLTLLIAVKLWCEDLSGKVIRFNTDNQNCMFAINRGRSRDKYILECLRELTWTLAKYEILLKAQYINTKMNTLPDALSRWYSEKEARRIVRRITKNRWRRRSVPESLFKFNTTWD